MTNKIYRLLSFLLYTTCCAYTLYGKNFRNRRKKNTCIQFIQNFFGNNCLMPKFICLSVFLLKNVKLFHYYNSIILEYYSKNVSHVAKNKIEYIENKM